MKITKEFVEARMAEFKQQKEQHLQIANRFEGALLAMQVVLDELNKPRPKAPEEGEPKSDS